MSNLQKFTLTLNAEGADGKRWLLLDKRKSHQIPDASLTKLLEQARLGQWKHNPEVGLALGRRLYDLLDGSGGALSEALGKCDRRRPVEFHMSLPADLDGLPVELLADAAGFLQMERTLNIYRSVMDRSAKWEPEDRPLKMLFMAASPTDLAHATLSFEKEEEAIQQVVDKWPVDLTIDDLGGVVGLEESVKEQQGFDVIHISGHANSPNSLALSANVFNNLDC